MGECVQRLLGYGGRVVAHHLGEEEQWHYLVHVLLEEHAGELSDASRRIHRLQNRSGGPVQSWWTRGRGSQGKSEQV